jgi:ribosomal RNA-processing protein 1
MAYGRKPKANRLAKRPQRQVVESEQESDESEGDITGQEEEQEQKPKEEPKKEALPLNFGKRLAHTDKVIRDRGLRVLKLWLDKHRDLERLDYLKLWKGLYFGLWMSDKRPVQQELSVNIALLINDIPAEKQHLWMDTYWETMHKGWENLDVHRINKYLLFLRIVTAEYFKVLRERGWKTEDLKQAASILTRTIGEAKGGPNVVSSGLLAHLARVFWQELTPQMDEAKVSTEALVLLLEPFIEIAKSSWNEPVVKSICSGMLTPVSEVSEELVAAVLDRTRAALTQLSLPKKNREALAEVVAALAEEPVMEVKEKRLSKKLRRKRDRTDFVYEWKQKRKSLTHKADYIEEFLAKGRAPKAPAPEPEPAAAGKPKGEGKKKKKKTRREEEPAAPPSVEKKGKSSKLAAKKQVKQASKGSVKGPRPGKRKSKE